MPFKFARVERDICRREMPLLKFLSRWLARRRPAPDADLFRALAEHNSDVLCRVGPDLLIKYASPSAKQVLGWEPAELVGRYFHEFTPAEDLALIAAAKAREGQQGDSGHVTLRFRRRDGVMLWVEGTGRPLRDEATGTVDSVVSFRDATARYELQQHLAAQATTDGLTGLANRRMFDDVFAREWRRALREHAMLSVLLIDVDHFKQFNDSYGHQTGDDCLRAVAATIAGVIYRPGDLAARYGGEEMAIILAGTDAAGALAVAEKARVAVESLRLPHVGNPEGNSVVTVSIGVATAIGVAHATVKMPDGLLRSADHALYKAKRDGRNRIATALLIASEAQAA